MLGLRVRGNKSISRVYGVFSADTSCLSLLKDKSSTELLPTVHNTFLSFLLYEAVAPVYLQVCYFFSKLVSSLKMMLNPV